MNILNVEVVPFATVPYRSAMGGGRVADLALPLFRGRVDALPPGLEAVLVTSDLQGRRGSELLGEALATEVLALAAAGTVPPPDRIGVIFAGDLFAAPKADVRGASGDVSAVWSAFAAFRWVVGVPGNHDTIDPRRIGRGQVLDGGVAVCDGLRLAGLGGIVGNPKKPQRRSEVAYDRALRGLVAESPDLVVLHEGPAGGDRQHGRVAVNDAVDGRVRTVVCGHAHWHAPLARLPGGTVVLNVDARVVLLIT